MKNTKMTTAIVLIAIMFTSIAMAKPSQGRGHALGHQKHQTPSKGHGHVVQQSRHHSPSRGHGSVVQQPKHHSPSRGHGSVVQQPRHHSPSKGFSFSISSSGFHFGTSRYSHHPRTIYHRPVVRHIPRPTYRHYPVQQHCQPEAFIVWVTKCNGHRVPVRIEKRGMFYYGPRGELYTHIPSEHQLRVIYGN
jgi:hypothetical protein